MTLDDIVFSDDANISWVFFTVKLTYCTISVLVLPPPPFSRGPSYVLFYHSTLQVGNIAISSCNRTMMCKNTISSARHIGPRSEIQNPVLRIEQKHVTPKPKTYDLQDKDTNACRSTTDSSDTSLV